MKHVDLTGNLSTGNSNITMKLPVMIFEEDGIQIAYVPILDISGYGNTEGEARESLTTALENYFCYTTNKKTLAEDLKKHGWIVKKKKDFIAPPDITDILQKNEYLHNIVNNKPYSMQRIDVNIPQLA